MSTEADKDIVVGVLDGRESAEQAALKLGVSADEVLRRCELVQIGAALGQARPAGRPWAVALGGLVALGVVSLWARSAISAACADPTYGPLPSSMIKLCPESAALAGPVNTNFSKLSDAISTRFKSPKLNDPPGAWVTGTLLATGAVDSSKLASNAVNATHLPDEIVPGSKFPAGSIAKQKLSRKSLYSMNVACFTTKIKQSFLDSPDNVSPFSPSATCTPFTVTPSPCGPGMAAYIQCGTPNSVTACVAAPPACNNTLLGDFIAP